MSDRYILQTEDDKFFVKKNINEEEKKMLKDGYLSILRISGEEIYVLNRDGSEDELTIIDGDD